MRARKKQGKRKCWAIFLALEYTSRETRPTVSPEESGEDAGFPFFHLRNSVVTTFLFLLLPVWGVADTDTNSPAMRYARLHERELAGEVAGALAGYRELLPLAQSTEPRLAARLQYRVGVCELRLGRLEMARAAWRALVETAPAADPLVSRAREELKRLERELDRIVVQGRVVLGGDQRSEVGDQRSEVGGQRSANVISSTYPNNLATQQLNNCIIIAGEWGGEPPSLSDTDGVFRLERKAAGETPDGRRYCLLYAEHPFLLLEAAEIVEAGSASRDDAKNAKSVVLSPPLTLTGRVVDARGTPVVGAAIRVTGFDAGVPMPFDRLLPPVVSGPDGGFVVSGLVPGLRYVLAAEKEGFRLAGAAEVSAERPDGREAPVRIDTGTIRLLSLGVVSLSGRVVDEAGLPARMEVSAWSMPPVERELARVSTDEAGMFIFRDLQENLVSVRITQAGYVPKSVIGLKPMGQAVDLVVKRSEARDQRSEARDQRSEARDQRAEGGETSATQQFNSLATILPGIYWLRGNPETGGAVTELDLKGRVVVCHFGSAYLESAWRSRYPGAEGILSILTRVYGDDRVRCLWLLPEGESGREGEAAKLALELYPDLPVGGAAGLPSAGNLVFGPGGQAEGLCSDLQLFKMVKAVLKRE